MKNQKTVFVFLFVELCCYSIFLALDFFETSDYMVQISMWIKWCSIAICFAFVTFYKPVQYQKKEKSVLSLALFFTVVADFFLLMTSENWIGVLCFIVIQSLYLYRLSIWKEEILFINRFIKWGFYGVGIFLFLFLIGLKGNAEILAVSIYFVSLIDNITLAASIYFYHVGSKRKSGCFFIGLCLLCLCDIQVAIYNAELYLNVQEVPILSKMMSVARIAMWFFYLPSQVLIALSGRIKN